MKRAARSATVGSSGAGGATGSRPRRMRSIIPAAFSRASSASMSSWRPTVAASATRPASRLGDEELAPGGVDPYPEPRQLAVPEHRGSAFDGQAVDGSLAQFDGAHGGQSFPCPGTRAARPGDPSVTVPRRPDGLPEFREANGFTVRKSVFKSQSTDVKSVLPLAPACPFPGLVPDPRRKHNVNDYSELSSY